MQTLLLLLILVPVGLVILLLSMLLANYIAGGMDFGPLYLVLLKSIPFLIVLNLVGKFVPFTLWFWLSLPLWWLGVMLLFRLDVWEARLLVVVNWLLNFALQLLIATVWLQLR